MASANVGGTHPKETEMPTITLNRFNPFAGWTVPAAHTTQKPDRGALSDGDRREYLTQLFSADYCGCGSEAGASAMMAMFPRDF